MLHERRGPIVWILSANLWRSASSEEVRDVKDRKAGEISLRSPLQAQHVGSVRGGCTDPLLKPLDSVQSA